MRIRQAIKIRDRCVFYGAIYRMSTLKRCRHRLYKRGRRQYLKTVEQS